ncbi:MAG: DNA-3-methyladenine glycosylase 2 family protein [Candidatus Nanopelagicales bacterium]
MSTLTVSDAEMQAAADHIVAVDPAFAEVIDATGLCTVGRMPSAKGDHFADLVDSIIAQQLSTKAADTIGARLRLHLDGVLTPQRILDLDDELLRGAGLSGAKTRTIRGLAEALHSGSLDLAPAIASGDDDTVSRELQKMWGIGRWTAEMFLIFTLHRLDIWPVGDLAMRRGWDEVHRSDATTPNELDVLGEPLRPYRSIVAWYCWRQVDGDNPSW